MTYLTSATVVAQVRPSGSIGIFEQRVFHPLLDSQSTNEQQQLESIRLIRQLGYETRNLEVFPPLED
jgi:hypothetical protein